MFGSKNFPVLMYTCFQADYFFCYLNKNKKLFVAILCSS